MLRSKNLPMVQLAQAEAAETERKRAAAARIAKAWKQAEDRSLQVRGPKQNGIATVPWKFLFLLLLLSTSSASSAVCLVEH